LPNFLRIAKRIMVENGPYDAVHSHVNIANSWVMVAAFLAGIPIRISHCHAVCEEPSHMLKSLYRKVQKTVLLKYATHWLACSDGAGNSLYGRKQFSNKGLLMCNGINVDTFCKVDTDAVQSLRKEFGIEETNLVLSSISRYDRNKNQCFAVCVFREILKEIPQAVLVLGGTDGDAANEVREAVFRCGVEKSVRFIGKRTDMAQCLQLTDIFLMPSIHEGFGIALLEAQAAGCFCIASTGVPATADLGLEAVLFLDLKLQASEWAEKILCAYRLFEKKSPERIVEAFEEKGFSVNRSLVALLELYDGKK